MRGNTLLSKSIIPKLYKIKIHPIIESGKFYGRTKIHLAIDSIQNHIIFNSVALKYKRIVIFQICGEKKKELLKWQFSNENEYKNEVFQELEDEECVKINVEMLPGEAMLEIDYEGTISSDLCGFYKAKYFDETGNVQTIGVTQFEAAFARRAFPCWDEPSFKAKFVISIRTEGGLKAISNMALQSIKKPPDDPSGEAAVYKFYETPLMNTYLIAFVVGNLKMAESSYKTIKVRIYTEPNSINKALFALDVAVKFLEYYQKYFDFDYPLTKLDLVAVPDFACGAMENWGLVTFRDTCIFCDDHSSQKAKERVAIVVAHELAHQWFGNLVTMTWWTHLWLNEGFASFMEIKATDEIFPRWQIREELVSEQLSHALFLDSFEHSHPIEVEVENPKQIDEIFDTISYEKGALVVRMLHDFLGEEHFKYGMRKYIRDFSYSNATTGDLWEKLAGVSEQNVEKMMSEFTAQKGYPLLCIKETNGGRLSLNQAKFITRTARSCKEKSENLDITRNGTEQIKEKEAVEESDKIEWKEEPLWKVPILTEKGESFLLEKREMVIDVPHNYIVNYKASGFFRTLFSRDIIQKIDLQSLPVLNLFSLLNDTFAAVYLGDYGDIATLFDLLDRMHEVDIDSVVVWKEICSILTNLMRIFRTCGEEGLSEKLRKFAIAILRPKYNALGWEFKSLESLQEKKQRVETIAALSELDFEEVVTEGKKLFKEFLYQNHDLNEDIKKTIFEIGCKYGNERDCESLKAKILNSSNVMDKINALKALGNFRDESLLLRLLNLYKTNEVRVQDFTYLAFSVASNLPLGPELVWKWLRENFDELSVTFKGRLFADFVWMLKSFATKEKADEIQTFFADKNTTEYARKLAQMLENIRIKADFIEKCKTGTKAWLDKKLF